MNTPLQGGRAVRYACAVLADCRISALPVDPFALSSRAGITMLPLSQVQNYPLWVPYDIADALRMTCAYTLTYPTFCIVFRDTGTGLRSSLRDIPRMLPIIMICRRGIIGMNCWTD